VSLFLGIALLIIGIEVIAVGWTGRRMQLTPTGARKCLNVYSAREKYVFESMVLYVNNVDYYQPDKPKGNRVSTHYVVASNIFRESLILLI